MKITRGSILVNRESGNEFRYVARNRDDSVTLRRVRDGRIFVFYRSDLYRQFYVKGAQV